MRVAAAVLVIVMLAPRVAAAQATTADGVQALARGDYASAVRILRPLAEDTSQPDSLAAFFMATLYHAGHGVARNESRASGLYLRAAIATSPLVDQSLRLAQSIHQDHPIAREQCHAAAVGQWREPPPSSFALGTGHSVRIDHEGFTVAYQGTVKRDAMTMGGVGWLYLPTRHTQIEVTHPTAHRRNFIEFFIWMPHRRDDRTDWALWWAPYEVIGLETRAVGGGAGLLATLTAARPPAAVSVDEWVRIQLNAAGEVEWTVSGTHARSGVVPPTDSTDLGSLASTFVSPPTRGAVWTGRSDGIAAFVRGDYQRAAAILKPLAESWPPVNPAAAFLMATLYETGRGVPADPIRACALYVLAGIDRNLALADPSDTLLRTMQQSHSEEAFRQCMLLVNVGFAHGFEPVIFELGAGHWISLDLDSATINYAGQEQKTDQGWATSGTRFLPLLHTELMVGATASTRRHFIEVSRWTPHSFLGWVLRWHVFEVVGLELVDVVSRELMTAPGDRPPLAESIDLRSLALLRVNGRGEPEWVVLVGDERGIIAPPLRPSGLRP
ncbi:MAG TPA: hypothetical protein VNJ02_20195 [Vicinamibacterales bacterium]|nr:hypothetical protein [Vicinamibacterales bacterium]